MQDIVNKREIKKEWDELYGHFPLESLPWHSERPARALVDAIKKGGIKKCNALDICCGAGTNSLYLAVKGFRVTGLDISGEALRLAKKRFENSKISPGLVNGDAANLPFKDKTFGFVFDRGCFHHIPMAERPQYVEEAHRVLKPGGNFLLICFSDKNPPRENTFSKKAIADYFSPHFEIIRIKSSVFRELRKHPRFFYVAFMEPHP
ncbi:MAG: class I SAM-dependent methyltransferase [Candidatus Omnitrophota bacterium]